MIYVERRDVAEIVNATFPEYKGKRTTINVVSSIRLSGTQWDGGSRSQYRLLRLEDNTVQPIPVAPFMQDSIVHDSVIEIPEGFVFVQLHEWGNHTSLTIHCRTGSIRPTLDAPIVLTKNERVVLEATRSLESSYGGVKNFRYEERGRGVMTLSEWEATKTVLVGKGYLDKRGAITVSGRNAIA